MSQVLARLEVELDANTGGLAIKMSQAGKTMRVFRAEVDRTNSSVRNIERSVTGLGTQIRDLFVILGQARAAMHTLWMATGQWVGEIIKANAEIERLTVLMRGLSTETSEAAQMREAQQNLEYVLDTAKQAPFALKEIANSFVKMKSAGIDPTTGAMSALTNAVAAFGGDDQVFHRATIAIQQMAGKGVISMEELRQQLGEAVPSAMRLMAQSMGISVGELVKKISSGRVEANDALRRMMNEMNITFAGRASDMMQTWNGLISQLKTEWFIFAKAIGDSGLFEAAKQGVRELLTLLKSREGKEFAQSIGEGLGVAVRGIIDFTKYLIENRAEIAKWTKLVLGMMIAAKVAGTIAVLTRAIVSLRNAMLGLSVASTAATGITALSAAIGRAIMSVQRFGLIMAGLRGALAVIGGPIGIAVAALSVLALKLYDTWQETRRADEAWSGFRDNLAKGLSPNTDQLEEAQNRLAAYSEALLKFREARSKNQRAIESKQGMNVASDQFVAARDELEDLAQELIEGGEIVRRAGESTEELVRRAIENLRNEFSMADDLKRAEGAEGAAAKWADDLAKGYEGALRKLGVRRSELYAQLFSENPDEKISRDEYIKRNEEAIADTFGTFIQKLEAQKAQLAEAMKLPISSPGQAAEQNAQMDELKTRLGNVVRLRNEMLADLRSETKLLDGPGAGPDKKAADDLKNYLLTVEGQVASLKAKTDEANPGLAKFEALLSGGKFGANPNQGIANEIRKLLVELDQLKDEDKKVKALAAAMDKLGEIGAKVDADLQSFYDGLSGDVYSEASRGMTGLNRQIAVLRDEVIKSGNSVDEFDAAVAGIRSKQAEIDLGSLAQRFLEVGRAAELSAMTDKERRAATFQDEINRINASLAIAMQSEGDKTQIVAAAEYARAQIRADYDRQNMTQVQSWVEQYKDLTEEVDQFSVAALDRMSDAIVEFARTGKLSVRDMVADMLAQFLKLQTNQAFANILNTVMGAWTGAAAGPATPTNSVGPLASGYVFPGGKSAPMPSIGMPSDIGSSVPTASSIPGGKSSSGSKSMGDVQINLVNETGQQMEAKEQGRRFDGEKMVLDLVLAAANRPGKFRDGMKGALR